MKKSFIGALPSQHIFSLVCNRFIQAERNNIKPASLDLSITDEIYEIEGSFQVPRSSSVFSVLQKLKKKKVVLGQPLEVGKYYIAKINEKFDLPENIYGYANPKSTTGRLDIHARLLADRVPQNDAITKGFRGDLWITIKPQSFSILLYPGVALNQMRLFYSDARLTKNELEQMMQHPGLLFCDSQQVSYKDMEVKDSPDSIVLRLDGKVGNNGEPVGYRAKQTKKVIDYRKQYKAEEFFVPIVPDKNNMMFLPKDCFSILSSIESVSVPAHLACEMASIDDRFGEFRSHYAGFIDPGWDCRPLTLEVRPFENVYVCHGQPIGRIKYEYLAEMPDITYDAIASNYTKQVKAKLAKQFI